MSQSLEIRRKGRCSRVGFTLLELIIVLVVLVALAALVVPLLGFVRDQANYATAAAGAAETLNNLEIYKASTGNYPNRLDTIVDTNGSYYSKAYAGDASGAFPYGEVVSGASASFGYFMGSAGMTEFLPHDNAVADPNASSDSTPVQSFAAASFLVIDPSQASGFSVPKAQRIVKAAYPNQLDPANPAVPTGHTLVAFGVGSRSSVVGSTMLSAPVHQAGDPETYTRYIAVFDVSAGPTGRGKVQLKMVLDSEFEILAKNVANYTASGPVDEEAGTAPVPPTPPAGN